jgi:hypothetical protein
MKMKPTRLSLIIVSIITTINILATFLIRSLWGMLIDAAKLAPAAQRNREHFVASLVVVLYLVLSLVVLNSWKNGKRLWDFILLGLTLLHFVSVYCFFVFRLGEFLPIAFIPLALDVIILLTVILDKRLSKIRNR